MAYHVEITPEAERDLDEAYRYIAEGSPLNALRWWRRFYVVAERPESEAVPFEVRQKLYGKYRILFTIQGDRVIVLRVRHAARLPLPPDEIRGPIGA